MNKILLIILFSLIIPSCAWAYNIEGYSLNQWANAIHKAEGNDNYGILSVQCVKGQECRQVCKRTVLNNYKRWKKSKSSITYLQFLGKRYCPIGASNDTAGLNRFWIKNVGYYLQKGV